LGAKLLKKTEKQKAKQQNKYISRISIYPNTYWLPASS